MAVAPHLPRRGVVRRLTIVLGSLSIAASAVALGVGTTPRPVLAAHTPSPSTVTIAGSMQSEAGCPGDWDPACATTHLTYDAGDDVWQGTWSLPAGSWEYKAALDDSWNENYGLHAAAGGANIPLTLGSAGSVKFYYDHKTHWVADDHGSVIATAAGSFQSELGCPGDWDPGCLRSWLEDPAGSGTYGFETTALPAGAYEAKIAIDESWSENYGQGGVPGGANIPFTVPSTGTRVSFSYDPTTHVLTITVDRPELSLTKAASPATYGYAGQVVTYTYAAKNTGTVALAGPVSIADDRLGGFLCGAAAGLAPGAAVSCTRTYTITTGDLSPSGGASITNRATATASYQAAPVISNEAKVTIVQGSPRPTEPPTILFASPGSGRAGSLVTVTGLSLGYARRVTFNGVPATFSVRAPSIIVATVPAGATTGPIRVTTPFGSASSPHAFFVLR